MQRLIVTDRCVMLDGGTATELEEVAEDRPELEERLWGTSALVNQPDAVLRVPPQLRRRGLRRHLD